MVQDAGALPVESVRILGRLSDWVSDAYPEYPYTYWGQSGTALLFDALRRKDERKSYSRRSFVQCSLSWPPLLV